MPEDLIFDFYAFLGIEQHATLEDIQRRMLDLHRKLIRAAGNSPSKEKQREAEDGLEILDEARAVFANATFRTRYDEDLAAWKQQKAAEEKAALAAVSQKPEIVPGNSAPPPPTPEAPPAVDLYRETERAIFQLEHGDLAEALRVIQSVLKQESQYMPARKTLARIYIQAGTEEAASLAKQELTQVLILSPRDAEAMLLMGFLLESEGAHVQAERYFAQGIEHGRHLMGRPLMRNAIFHFSSVLMRNGKYEQARDMLEPLQAKSSGHDNKVASDLLMHAYIGCGFQQATEVTMASGETSRYFTSRQEVDLAMGFLQQYEACREVCGAEDSDNAVRLRQALKRACSRIFVGEIAIPAVCLILFGIPWIPVEKIHAVVPQEYSVFISIYTLVVSMLYFFSSRKPVYVINRLALQHRPAGGMEHAIMGMFGWRGIGRILSIGVSVAMLPAVIIWNFLANYAFVK